MSRLGRLEPADDPLAPTTWIVDDDDDRLEALGGVPGGRATAARQLVEVRAQGGMNAILEPGRDVPTLARREAEPIVAADRNAHAPADERPVAVCGGPRRDVA